MEQSRYFVHLGLAVSNAMAGLFQSVYCCIFYTYGMCFWNSLLLICVGMYGVTREHVGARFVVYSHLGLLAIACVLLTQCAVGLNCIYNICETQMWTKPIQDECVGAFADRPDLLSGLPRIHTAILFIIGVGATVQIGTVFFFIIRSIWAFLDAVKHHVNVYYWMSAISIVTFIMGVIHTMYCSHLYFTFVGILCPLIVLVVSILTNIHTCEKDLIKKTRKRVSSVKDSVSSKVARKSFLKSKHTRRSLPSTLYRRLHICVLVSSLLLLLVASFGIYCGQSIPSTESELAMADLFEQGNTTSFSGVLDKSMCSEWIPRGIYYKCYDNLQNIGFWHSHDTEMRGLGTLQFCLSIGLCVSATVIIIVGGSLEHRYRHLEGKIKVREQANLILIFTLWSVKVNYQQNFKTA